MPKLPVMPSIKYDMPKLQDALGISEYDVCAEITGYAKHYTSCLDYCSAHTTAALYSNVVPLEA